MSHPRFGRTLVLTTAVVLSASSAQAAPPKRIVSLSPTATESLFAIGAGSQVIAVDDQSNYPSKAPKTKLSGFTPNIEAIAAYKPDLVVTAFDTKGLVAALTRLKIRVVLQSPAKDLKEAYGQIQTLGNLTGHPASARVVTTSMRNRIASIVVSTPKSATPLSVFHEISADGYSATSKTFIGQVYKDLGLRNIADGAPDSGGAGYPQLTAEYVVTQNPDLVVLSDTSSGETPVRAAGRPGWNLLTAVKRGAVAPVNEDIASRWGPRIVGLYKVMSGRVKAATAR